MRIRPDKVERLRSWMAELGRRIDEVRATFAREGVQRETVYFLSEPVPLLVYIVEATDLQAAREAFKASTMLIDDEHKRVLADVIDERVPAELLFDGLLDPADDVRPPGGRVDGSDR